MGCLRLILALFSFSLLRRLSTMSHDVRDLPPPIQMLQFITGKWIAQALYAVATLGVADHLVDGPKTSETLARSLNAHPSALHRLLRALASIGVFEIDGRASLV